MLDYLIAEQRGTCRAGRLTGGAGGRAQAGGIEVKIEVFVAGVAAVVGVDAAAHQVVGTDCVADIEDGAEKKREPLVIEVATRPM